MRSASKPAMTTKAISTRHLPKVLVASLAFLIGLASAGRIPYEIGRVQAYIDVARGIHRLQIYGLIRGEMEEFSEIAASEYAIEVVSHGCVISDPGAERINGYNVVSLAAIKRKYGDAVMESIWEQAERQHRVKRLTH